MMIFGVRSPWSCRSRGYACFIFMANQPASKSGATPRLFFPFSAVSTLFVICASALLGLATLSMLVHDLDRSWALSSGPSIQLRRGAVFAQSHYSVQDVPNEGNLSSDNSIWESTSANFFYGCSEPGEAFQGAKLPFKSNGFLMIDASGGLNQQRTGITDAVVVARLLNATLVVPGLDHKSYWKDTSNFSDIFDVDLFIKSLASDVTIVKEVPEAVRLKYMKRRLTSMRVQRKCTPQYYQNKILPVLQKRKVLRLTKFDYRLSNKLEPELQKLRCRVNYRALQFTPAILEMGYTLVRRVRQMSSRYIALHLRYESDMLAFSGCYYGGGDQEIQELGAIRKRWKSLHIRSPEKERRNGKCPLTPKEVGLMLRALGFGNDSYLYVASGEVYGGEASLAPLKALFPNYFTKETLAGKEELKPFTEFSSRMAALDYIVSDQSNVFVTNNNGNMARILAGRRRYYGHKKTIRPNTKKLGSLFLAREEMSWEAFASKVQKFQEGFMGEPNEMKVGRGEFHENPVACICDRRRRSSGSPSSSSSSSFMNQTEQGDIEDGSYNVEQELEEDQLNSFEMEGDKGEVSEQQQRLQHNAEELPLFSD